MKNEEMMEMGGRRRKGGGGSDRQTIQGSQSRRREVSLRRNIQGTIGVIKKTIGDKEDAII